MLNDFVMIVKVEILIIMNISKGVKPTNFNIKDYDMFVRCTFQCISGPTIKAAIRWYQLSYALMVFRCLFPINIFVAVLFPFALNFLNRIGLVPSMNKKCQNFFIDVIEKTIKTRQEDKVVSSGVISLFFLKRLNVVIFGMAKICNVNMNNTCQKCK